jgi:hypothetical protein
MYKGLNMGVLGLMANIYRYDKDLFESVQTGLDGGFDTDKFDYSWSDDKKEKFIKDGSKFGWTMAGSVYRTTKQMEKTWENIVP